MLLNKLQKNNLREYLLKKRNSLSPEIIKKRSKIISKRVLINFPIKPFCNIHLYLPLKSEVDTSYLIEQFGKIRENKIFVSELEGKSIKKYRLEYASKGAIKKIPIKTFPYFSIIFVPGIAFDLEKNRLGFGGGFYDRFLSKRKNSLKVGLAYDWQIVDSLPVEKHDIQLDYIITEKRVIE